MDDPARRPILATLSVDAVAGGLRFRLERPAGGHVEPLEAEYVQRTDAETLAALLGSADALLRGAPRIDLVDEACRRGGTLFRTIVPPALAPQLAAVDGPLLIRTSVFGVPWELLHDGSEFWGIRYALGRRLVTERPVPPVRAAAVPARPRALIVGADPRRDLPSVAGEIEAIAAALAPHADVVCIGTPLATLDSVLNYLGQRFDLIHFAGHIVADDAGEVGLLLGDGRLLRATAIPAAITGRPLVVLNGCGSARSDAGDRRPNWEESLSGAAHGFLFGGAIAVLGTLAEVRDRPATVFAETFYRHLLSYDRVGEALRRARIDCRTDPRTVGAPDWLSFALYGSPNVALRNPDSEPPAERAPVRRVSRRAVLVAGAAVAGAGALGAVVTMWLRRQPVIGVMAARAGAGNAPPWMRKLTRNSLTTVLTEVADVSVFSQEKIDLLCKKEQLCGIAGAERLRMTHMITPSVSVAGERVALEVEVIDVSSGLVHFSERVQGPRNRFIELQNQLHLAVLDRLGVQPRAQDRRRILAERTDDMLDSYRMLMETLGGELPAGDLAPPTPTSRPSSHSWLVREAYAEEGDDAAIRRTLDAYAQALAAHRIDDVTRLQVRTTPAQRAAIEQYFAHTRNLTVVFSNVEVLVSGAEAVASYVREDRFTDTRLGRPMHLKVQLSTHLAKTPDGWRIELPK